MAIVTVFYTLYAKILEWLHTLYNNGDTFHYYINTLSVYDTIKGSEPMIKVNYVSS